MVLPDTVVPENKFKSGYVTLIGKPNVGKSTLLNRLVEQKLAAMTRRPQTTRNRITGVCHLPEGQIILLDTPGIHKAKSTLNEMMVKTSLNTFEDADLIAFMMSAEKFAEEDDFVLQSLKRSKTPKILVLNKIDRVSKPKLLDLMGDLNQRAEFVETVPISALKEDGLDLLKERMLAHLPEGPPYFPEDMVTDCPEEFLIEEVIREKVIRLTSLEVPYAAAVVVEFVGEGRQPGVTLIQATLIVEKTSQKKIVIGENGQRLKQIGTQARLELEKRLGGRLFLELVVKVKERWRDNPRLLKQWGLTDDSH